MVNGETLESSDWRKSAIGRRSLAIFAVGAAIGLAAAGYSLFTARGTVVRGVPVEDVALVNRRPILVSDFNAQLQNEIGKSAVDASPAERARIRDEMIREELFVQRGLSLDMPSSDPATRSALVIAVEQQAQADAVAEQPSEETYRRYYTAHLHNFATEGRITVTDFHTPLRGDTGKTVAIAAAAALALHTAPVGLSDSKRSDGDEFYFAARLHLGPILFAAARRLAPGQVSAPIEQADGWHVLVMHADTPPHLQSFAAALPQVMTRFRQEAGERGLTNELQYLRESADLQIAKAYR